MANAQTLKQSGNTARARVFISYSRKDLPVAERLLHDLEAEGFDAFLDLHDIKPGEPWRDRLGALIASAEKVIFLISPHSVASEVCAWEVAHAEELGKSILPVVARKTDHALIPDRLGRLNFIDYRTGAARTAAHAALCEALDTDLAWEREKTRINDLAGNWDKAGRPARLLMFADDAIRAAEGWRDRHPDTSPPPTELQLAFIAASRARQVRRQRLTIAVSLAVAAVTSVLAVYAFNQSRVAERERQVAERQRALAEENAREAERQSERATAETERAERQRDEALLTQSRFLARASGEALASGDVGNAVALARAALPSDPDNPDRPVAQSAIAALLDAVSAQRRELRTLRIKPAELDHLIPAPDETVAVLLGVAPRQGRLISLRTLETIAAIPDEGAVITEAAFSPDTTQVAVARADGTIRFHDAGDGTPGHVIESGLRDISEIAFNPDGTLLLARGMDSAVRVWGTADAGLKAELRGQDAAIAGMKLSRDGQTLVSWDTAANLFTWRLPDGAALARMRLPLPVIDGVFLSPDGTRVLCVTKSPEDENEPNAETEQAVGLFDAQTGDPLYAARSGTDTDKREIHVNASAERFVVTQGSRLIVRSWSTGAELAQWDTRDAAILNVFLPDDGDAILALDRDQRLHLWHGAAGTGAASLNGHLSHVLGAAYDPGESRIVTWSMDGTARLWDAKTGAPRAVLRGHEGPVTHAEFIAGGQAVFTASGFGILDDLRLLYARLNNSGARLSRLANAALTEPDKTYRLWNAEDGQPLSVLRGLEVKPAFTAVLSGTARAVSTDLNGSLRLWDIGVDTGRPERSLDSIGGPAAMAAISGDARTLITVEGKILYDDKGYFAGDFANIRFWDMDSGKMTGRPAALAGPFEGVAANDGPDTLLAWNERELTHIPRSGRPERFAAGAGNSALPAIDGVEVSPSGNRVAVHGDDGRVHVFDARSMRRMATLEAAAHTITDAVFSPDGERIVSWSAPFMGGLFSMAKRSSDAAVWNARSGKPGPVLTGHEDTVTGAAFMPAGDRVLTWSGGIVGGDSTVRLWNAKTGEHIRTFAHEELQTLARAVPSPDGRLVAVWDIGGNVLVWDIDGNLLAERIPHYAKAVVPPRFSPDSRQLLTVDEFGVAHLYETGSFTETRQLKASDNPLIGAGFSADGKRIVTWAFEDRVRIWPNFVPGLKASEQTVYRDAGRIIAELDPLTRGERCAYFLETEENCNQPAPPE